MHVVVVCHVHYTKPPSIPCTHFDRLFFLICDESALVNVFCNIYSAI